MHFVVIGKDKDDGASRRCHRAEHLLYVEGKQALIVYGGPLLESGRMIGSIFVFDVPDRNALDAYMADDPYFNPGIFGSVEIYESRWMVPERQEGSLQAEAAAERRRTD
jgi:uncharacterized protein YciI